MIKMSKFVNFIGSKDDIKSGSVRLLKALVSGKRADKVIDFLGKCSHIFLHGYLPTHG